jgi:hypothetical protein
MPLALLTVAELIVRTAEIYQRLLDDGEERVRLTAGTRVRD